MAGDSDRSKDANHRSRPNRAALLFHREPLFFLAIAAALGIVVDQSLVLRNATTFQVWIVISVATATVWALFRRRPRISIAAILLFLAASFGLWHAYCDDRYDSASILTLASNHEEPAVLEGVVRRPITLRRNPLAETGRRENQPELDTRIDLRVHRIRIGQDFETVSGNVLVRVHGAMRELRPGDALRVFGMLSQFTGSTNPGAVDLRDVYRRRGLHGRVNVASVSQIERISTSSWRPTRSLASIAGRSRDVLLEETGESTGPLAVALVIGQRDFVDDDTRDLLLVTGTAHLLSVSGLHLAIIVLLARLIAALLKLRLTARVVFMLGVCLFYTAITGGRPPVMRAAVLVSTFLIAMWFRQPTQPINTLSLAGLVLLVINPANLFAIGVQLSFMAVATLILCSRKVMGETPAVDQAIAQEQRLEQLADTSQGSIGRYARYLGQWSWQLIWFSGCVTATSLPLVWYEFNVVSFISVLTNVVLSPALVVAVASGVVTAIVGNIVPSLAFIPGMVCDWWLIGMRWFIELAASIPYGHAWLPPPPSWWVVTFYVVLAASLGLKPGHRARAVRCVWIAFWIVAAWWMATRPTPLEEGTIEATFVDVGHGTSVVLRLDDRSVWLYDCGRLGNDTGDSRDIDGALWSVGATALDGIFLSHADSDHYNAVPGILKRFRVKRILTPPGMLFEQELGLVPIRQAIERYGVRVDELSEGDTLGIGNTSMRVLHPPPGGVDGSDNANSMVLAIEQNGKAIVLPGDLEPPGTETLIGEPRPPVGGVLMAPHHGSLTMKAESVLQWARPMETIVSGGKRSRRPEVQEMLAVTGSGVHITAVVGAIRVRIDENGQIEVRSWKESPW